MAKSFADKYWTFLSCFYGFFCTGILVSVDLLFGKDSVLGMPYWGAVDECALWFSRNFAVAYLSLLLLPVVHPKVFGTAAAKTALLKTMLPINLFMLLQFYLATFEYSSAYNTIPTDLGLTFSLWPVHFGLQFVFIAANLYAIKDEFKGFKLFGSSKKAAPTKKGRSASVSKKAK